jgi:hypothetical protein
LCFTDYCDSFHLGDELLSTREQGSGKRKFLPAVSTSLALAAGIGLMEMVGLIVGSGTLMDIVGIPVVRKTNLLSYSNFLDLKLFRWCLSGSVQCLFFSVCGSNADLKFQN